MPLGIITSIAACPAILGTTEAVRHGEKQNKREEHRGRKTHLTVNLLRHSSYSARFNGAKIVLKDSKLWVDVRDDAARVANDDLHPFTGYFLPYPDMGPIWKAAGYHKGEGMVTTISIDPPYLNWVYVDSATYEVKYGVREVAQPHIVGPFDCTRMDRRLMFEAWEGFIAVEEEEGDGLWGLYFDRKDDGLSGEGLPGAKGKRMLELEIKRTELRQDRASAVEERIERIQERKRLEEKKNENGDSLR